MPHTQKHNSRAHQFPESCPYYLSLKVVTISPEGKLALDSMGAVGKMRQAAIPKETACCTGKAFPEGRRWRMYPAAWRDCPSHSSGLFALRKCQKLSPAYSATAEFLLQRRNEPFRRPVTFPGFLVTSTGIDAGRSRGRCTKLESQRDAGRRRDRMAEPAMRIVGNAEDQLGRTCDHESNL